jgi:hypothetical protein
MRDFDGGRNHKTVLEVADIERSPVRESTGAAEMHERTDGRGEKIEGSS